MSSQGTAASRGPVRGWRSRRRLAALAPLAAALAACQTPWAPQPDPDAGLPEIWLHGRVVNFETCMHVDRCRPVEGVRVRLKSAPEVISEPTGGPGRFLLEVPAAEEDHLVVDPGPLLFAQTINPWAAPPTISDVYGIELYALPTGYTEGGKATLLTALALEGADWKLLDEGATTGKGGYIGQVLRLDDAGSHAVEGAKVTVVTSTDWPAGAPQPLVRYVDVIPQYQAGEVLLVEDWPGTGGTGIFVVSGRGQTGMLTIQVETSDTIFSEVVAPVTPGMVTMGMHVP
jgi:hypothetical protein